MTWKKKDLRKQKIQAPLTEPNESSTLSEKTDRADELRRQAEEIVRRRAAQSPINIEALSPEETLRMLHELQVHQIELEMQNEELRRTQTTLDALRARYFDLYNLAPVGYLILSEQGLILESNLTIANLLGVARNVLVKQPLSRFIFKEDQDIFYRHIKQTSRPGAQQAFDMRMVKKDGTVFWVHLTIATTEDAVGNLAYRAVTISDITEGKQAEEEIQNLARFPSENPNPVLRIARDGTLLYINQAGLSLLPEWHLQVGQNCPSMLKDVASEAMKSGSALLIDLEHGMRIYSFTVTPIAGVDYINLYGRDITEGKQAEEQLLRVQKLESLGILAGGIAHDFNNLMMVVQGYMDLVLADLHRDHVSHKYLLAAMKSIEQTKELTSRLLTFSRGGGPTRERCDLREIIRDSVLKTVEGTDVRVKFDFLENLWSAEIDELQMKQCFHNLATNAVEAMPQGGNLTIRVENVEIPPGGVLPLQEGSYLKMTFTDEGAGIPAEHLLKVFDPYFTTKRMSAQKGIGLGLSVCYSILNKHNGHISVESKPEKGTSFHLYLPVRVGHGEAKGVKETLSSRKGRVLIMDDEAGIRNIERIYLERLDYEVTDTKDGHEAVAAYRKALESGTHFDLVILDLTVPQGLGGQLAMERLLVIDPGVKALIASGYVDDPVIENYGNYGFLGALRKPFTGSEIKSLVEKILPG